MRIGVLALQGDFLEHRRALSKLGVEAPEARLPRDLEGLDGLIIPGGESTTIGQLAQKSGLADQIRNRAENGFPVWGTCAGMILLAKEVGRQQPLLGVMDIQVERNAFGRQVDSFEADIEVPALAVVDPQAENLPFHAVFIRAPIIQEVGRGVEILGRLEDGRAVAARQGALLATAFHPELTEDVRFHRYFMRLIETSPWGQASSPLESRASSIVAQPPQGAGR